MGLCFCYFFSKPVQKQTHSASIWGQKEAMSSPFNITAQYLLLIFKQIKQLNQIRQQKRQMMARKLFVILNRYTSVKESLRILELSTPTTKAQIKKKYLLMAKKYHPDSNDTVSNGAGKTEKQAAQQKFVDLSKAYQYLKDLNEKEINSLKVRERASNSDTTSSAGSQKGEKKMTAEQMGRQQAYDYFNQVHRRQAMGKQDIEKPAARRRDQRLPMYKILPEFFVGFGLLALALGDWSYSIYKRQREESMVRPAPSRMPRSEVFKSFNAMERLKNIKQSD